MGVNGFSLVIDENNNKTSKEMNLRRNVIALILMLSGVQVMAQNPEEAPKVQVSFVYPIGSAGMYSLQEEYQVSINILAGATGGISGVEVGGIANFTKGSLEGVQLAGMSNLVMDSIDGVQAAGFANSALGNVNGLQLGGFGNAILGECKGAQVSGFGGFVKDSVLGVQLAGMGAATTGGVVGLQASGFASYAGGLVGTQVSGFANVTTGGMKGNQVAGFANISTGPSEGVQIAGMINVATKIKGAQLGVLNYADSLDGIAIGFLSYARNGYHQFELSSNETFHTNLSFKTGTNPFYNIFSAGVRWNESQPVWALGYGIGTRKEFKHGLFVNADLSSHSVLPDNFDNPQWESFNKLGISLSKRLWNQVEVFGGASFNMWISEMDEPKYDYLNSRKYEGDNGNVYWIMYPGFQFGVRI